MKLAYTVKVQIQNNGFILKRTSDESLFENAELTIDAIAITCSYLDSSRLLGDRLANIVIKQAES